MQTTDCAVVSSPSMAKPYRTGVTTRRAILRALRLLASTDGSTAADVASAATMSPQRVRYHLDKMSAAGLLTADESDPRRYSLTDAGLLAAD